MVTADSDNHMRLISQGGGADRRFCGYKHDSSLVCCLPDASVQNVSVAVEYYQGEGLSRQKVSSLVHLHINDIGRKRDEVLQSTQAGRQKVKKWDLIGGYLQITPGATC